MGQVKAIGRLRYQIDWDRTGWYYLSHKGEQVNIRVFAGTVEYDGGSLRQIILGPLAISWGWAE